MPSGRRTGGALVPTPATGLNRGAGGDGRAPVRDESLRWTGADTLDALERLMRLDLALSRHDPGETRRAVSTGPALLEPVRRWLSAEPRHAAEPDASAQPGAAGVARSAHGEVDEYEVTGIEVATRMFRDCGERRVGGLRRKAVVGQLYEITELLEHTYPEDVTRRLFHTVAELAALAGTMAHEEGLDPTAQRYFLLALHAARQAGDEVLGGEILSRMAQQMVQLGYPRDALALIDCARQGSRDAASASVRSLFLLVEAWSYAHLGQVEDCHRAVGAAQEAFAHSQPHEDPPWLSSFGAADMVGMAGRAYRVLSEHDPGQAMHAEPLIRQALALRDPDNTRDRALDLINLAMTHLVAGDLAQACAAAEEALTLVDELRLSAYVLSQVRMLRAQAERNGSPEARSLAARLAALLEDRDDPGGGHDASGHPGGGHPGTGYRGATTTASIPGPACAPTTAPTSLR